LTNREKASQNIHDGDWGIYQTEKLLPIERYDPFSTYIDETGSIIGHKTIISAIRGKRPNEFKPTIFQSLTDRENHSTYPDTFCKLIKGDLPSIVVSRDGKIESDPFSVKPTETDLRSSTVFSTLNLYPPITRVLESNQREIQNGIPHPFGVSFVHIFTNHYTFPEEISIEDWYTFLKNYCLTIESTINHPKIGQKKNLLLQTVFNIGQQAGASIPHLHGQSILHIDPSGSGSKYKSYLRASQSQKVCLQCNYWTGKETRIGSSLITIKNRIILQNDDWMAFLSYAPEKDAHIRLLPRRHVSVLWELSDQEVRSLAPIIIESNKLLSNFVEHEGKKFHLSKDRNIIFRQSINPSDDKFHMFIDLLPVQQLGALEIIDNQKISSIRPETITIKMKTLCT
jgi:UDPglucose--hexose-1-phosphate uridylyltransferase